MNYFPFHIGDYDSNTSHLTWIEDAAYSRMIRLYYRTESPLPMLDSVCRLIRATTNQERKAVEQILGEFFVLEDDGWHNARCDAEIDRAKQKAERNRTVGKLGGRPKKAETKTVNSGNPQETQTVISGLPNETLPITNNQEPKEKETDRAISAKSPKAEKSSRLASDWELPDEWAIWAKQERSDLNPNAIANKFRDYWCGVPGAKGRKLDWFATWRNFVRAERKQAAGYESPWDKASRERMQALAPGVARRDPAEIQIIGSFVDEVRNVIAIESR